MSKKSWLKYLAGIVLFIGVLYLKGFIEVKLNNEVRTTFKMNYALLSVVMLLNTAIGVLLGIDHLLSEIKKEGRWKISIPKTVCIIIPSLYFALFYFIPLIKNVTVQRVLYWPYIHIFNQTTSFILIFQIILGYAIVSIFYKDDKKLIPSEEEGFSEDGYASDKDNSSDTDNESDNENADMQDETFYMRPENLTSDEGSDNEDTVNHISDEKQDYYGSDE